MTEMNMEEKTGRISPNLDCSSGGKSSQQLIETILGEMKCEFNKGVNVDKLTNSAKSTVSDNPEEKPVLTEVEFDDKVNLQEDVSEGELNVETGRQESDQKSDSTEENIEKDCAKTEEISDEKECSNGNVTSGKDSTEKEDAPILVVLNENEDGSNKKVKLNSEIASVDKVISVLKGEAAGPDTKDVTPNSGKRSLRSQVIKTPPEATGELTGVKRSARRRSKDSPRESVLQSAIARKEKSFSNLSHSEEKSLSSRNMKVGVHRSPRLSPIEKSQAAGSKIVGHTHKTPESKSKFAVPKSPRLLSQAGQHSSPESVKKSVMNSNKSENVCKPAVESHSTGVVNVKKRSYLGSGSNMTQSHKVGVDSVKLALKSQTPANTTPTYTKTGKRRYKPFKGLRYSFTGGTVRKTKLARRQVRERTWSESEDQKTIESKSDTGVLQEDSASVEGEVPLVNEADPSIESSSVQCDLEVVAITDSVAVHSPVESRETSEEVLTSLLLALELCPFEPGTEVSAAGRSDSPVVADACQPATQKRKLQPDEEEDFDDEGGKRSRHSHVPSPSPAEDSNGPAKPESTAISSGAGTAALCCCQIKSQLFVTSKGPSDLYCQAVDMMDGRFVGCSNPLGTQDVRMYRPSVKVPYHILCEVHINRLLRHNCCPGCGVFCTQGKFVRCASLHLYHRDCQLIVHDNPVCPHCGLDTPPSDSLLTLGAHKNPIFLPQQKPPKKYPSARMTFCISNGRQEEGTQEERAPSPLLVPSLALSLPSGQKTTSEWLPTVLDKDKLAHLLSVACGMNSACNSAGNSPRYTLKTLYNAAKTGHSEKLLAALAAGLNPNHQYRECLMGSALHAACAGGHLIAVHILLQAGAQMDMMDREQRTPLMVASSSNHNDIVKYLIKAGASVTIKGAEGQTALHMAAKAGNLEACHHLLAVPNISRSLIDCVDDGGWTSLVWAAEHCHFEVVRFLLENKADPLVRDAEQNIALHWSAFSGSVDISEMLLYYGCSVNCSNSAGDTPLHIGARQDKYNCVLLLLARGARVDLSNDMGDSPLNCCLSKFSDCYTAISLNVQLKALAKPREAALRILCNDISRGKESNPIQCVNQEDDEPVPKDYVYVSDNCFTSNISVDRTITSLQSCRCSDKCQSNSCLCAHVSIRCWYDQEGRLLPDFNYADPPMLFECNQGCSCNRITCTNRVVQHGLTTRFQLFRTRGKGWGVRTLRPIPKGSYVCEYIGEIISDCEADHREDDSYLFDLDNRDGETYCIDARHYGNIARFINHMCVPNLLPVRIFIDHQDLHFPRIAFFAKHDIEAEEELGIPVRGEDGLRTTKEQPLPREDAINSY